MPRHDWRVVKPIATNSFFFQKINLIRKIWLEPPKCSFHFSEILFNGSRASYFFNNLKINGWMLAIVQFARIRWELAGSPAQCHGRLTKIIQGQHQHQHDYTYILRFYLIKGSDLIYIYQTRCLQLLGKGLPSKYKLSGNKILYLFV